MSVRIALLLMVFVLMPMAATLVFLETGLISDPVQMMAVSLALALGLLAPVSRVAASMLVLHDIRKLNAFCSEIQKGRYGVRFSTGLERDDEHEILRLKRNMNWMAHHIETQTVQLRERLNESAMRTRFYEEMSFRDSLTGLYNRRFFDRLLPALRQEHSSGEVFLALFDCDCFKRINDSCGHQCGDEVLVVLGRVIADSVRDRVDYPFRFGGDEFGVAFCEMELQDCFAVCERIRSRFAAGNACGCTVSAGLTAWTDDMGSDPALLVSACDKCLYQAKGLGGNCVVSDHTSSSKTAIQKIV